ncbi:hypothetical protein KIPB_005815 [Kipferlia bialata]|uniref:Suppressor of forked domain-containing protein n=1 Tax=Kipferlia bialata TaxID=797122 RepID=A0A9K3GJC2_9EUKA|nr:hypothetical protein KIPB_005815 [Kipferlia bialata]|eukprot:g5815.t1
MIQYHSLLSLERVEETDEGTFDIPSARDVLRCTFDIPSARDVLRCCMPKLLSLDISKEYIRFILITNGVPGKPGSDECRAFFRLPGKALLLNSVIDAYEFVLARVGYSLYSGPLWTEYVTLVRSILNLKEEEGEPSLDVQKGALRVRNAYVSALQYPHLALDDIWGLYKEFEVWATGGVSDHQNKRVYKIMLDSKKTCAKRVQRWALIDESVIPTPIPTAYNDTRPVPPEQMFGIQFGRMPPRFSDELRKNMNSFQGLLNGTLVMPVPVIYVGGNHEASLYLEELPYGGYIAHNVYYMGRVGAVDFVLGDRHLRVAGISGIYDASSAKEERDYNPTQFDQGSIESCFHHRRAEVDPLRHTLSRQPQLKTTVLTHDWPTIVTTPNEHFVYIPKHEKCAGEQGSPLSTGLLTDITSGAIPVIGEAHWWAAHMHYFAEATVPAGVCVSEGQVELDSDRGKGREFGATSESLGSPVVFTGLAMDVVLEPAPQPGNEAGDMTCGGDESETEGVNRDQGYTFLTLDDTELRESFARLTEQGHSDIDNQGTADTGRLYFVPCSNDSAENQAPLAYPVPDYRVDPDRDPCVFRPNPQTLELCDLTGLPNPYTYLVDGPPTTVQDIPKTSLVFSRDISNAKDMREDLIRMGYRVRYVGYPRPSVERRSGMGLTEEAIRKKMGNVCGVKPKSVYFSYKDSKVIVNLKSEADKTKILDEPFFIRQGYRRGQYSFGVLFENEEEKMRYYQDQKRRKEQKWHRAGPKPASQPDICRRGRRNGRRRN